MARQVKVFYEIGVDTNIIKGELPHKDALTEARDLGYLSILVGPIGERGVNQFAATLTHIPWNRVIRIEEQ